MKIEPAEAIPHDSTLISKYINNLEWARKKFHAMVGHSISMGFVISLAGDAFNFLKAAASKALMFFSAVVGVANMLVTTIDELIQIARGKIKENVQTRLGAGVTTLALGSLALPMAVGAWVVAPWVMPAIFTGMGVVSAIKEHRIARETKQEMDIKVQTTTRLRSNLVSNIVKSTREEKAGFSSMSSADNQSSARQYYENKAEISKLKIKMRSANERKKASSLMIFGGVCLCLSFINPLFAVIGAASLLCYGLIHSDISSQEKKELKAIDAKGIPQNPLAQFVKENSKIIGVANQAQPKHPQLYMPAVSKKPMAELKIAQPSPPSHIPPKIKSPTPLDQMSMFRKMSDHEIDLEVKKIDQEMAEIDHEISQIRMGA